MRRKNLIGILLLCAAIAGTFLAFASASPDDRSCKETLDEPVKDPNSGKIIWESLSQQFFSAL